jgi:hypothetical protein
MYSQILDFTSNPIPQAIPNSNALQSVLFRMRMIEVINTKIEVAFAKESTTPSRS